MNCRVLQAVLVTALMGIFLPVWAQKNYYVVVGAFSTEENETAFTTHLPTFNKDTAYAMGNQNNLVHLYVLRTTSEALAVAKSLSIQRTLDTNELGSVSGPYESIAVSDLPEGKEIVFKKTVEAPPSASALADASSSKDAQFAAAATASPTLKPKTQMFKFTIETNRGEFLPGSVHFVDLERERDLASYPALEYTDLINPGENKNMALVCGVFGYKQSEKFIDYNSPSETEGAYMDDNGAWIIPYELERLEKGDVSVMYNVAFHKDASIMLPQSATDLDELLKMMQENPDYQITIHGHCNGKKDRKILASTNIYDPYDITSTKKFIGSAKMLSQLRANVVRNYLIQHGISSERVRTYAWGGRYELVDADSNYARLNDRIEIEIRRD